MLAMMAAYSIILSYEQAVSHPLRQIFRDARHTSLREGIIESIADGERAQAILRRCHRLSFPFDCSIELLDLHPEAFGWGKAPRGAATLVDDRQSRGRIRPRARQIDV